MRRLLILSLCLILINALAIFAVCAIGSHIETTESRLFATGDCSQPCWHGIQPGKTTLDQAEAILRSEPDFVTDIKKEPPIYDLTWTIISTPTFFGNIQVKNNIVQSIWFEAFPKYDSIPLKYAFEVLGAPTTVRISPCDAIDGAPAKFDYGTNVSVGVWLTYGYAHYNLDDAGVWLLEYSAPDEKISNDDGPQIAWRGFTSPPTNYYEKLCSAYR